MFFTYIKELIRFQQLPAEQRRIVFYSEGRNYWPHLAGIITTLIERTDIHVCYISSDAEDPGLALENPRFLRFHTDESWARNWLFENIEADVMVMTMPDLHRYQVKRSRHPVHYVYVQHSAVSLHMVYRNGAFDHYDSVFCAGPHHVTEMRALEKQRNLAPKHLVECGYSRLDAVIRDAKEHSADKKRGESVQAHVLIAPSWGEHCITETHGKELVSRLLAVGHRVTLRPHPMTLKFRPDVVDAICKPHIHNAHFMCEDNVGGTASLYDSDVMISDWSGAALDYAFGLSKPVVFIDVTRKMNNPDYADLAIVPLEEQIRPHIGKVISPENISDIAQAVEDVIRSGWDNTEVAHECIYNIGTSNVVACDAILEILSKKQIS